VIGVMPMVAVVTRPRQPVRWQDPDRGGRLRDALL